MDLTDLLSTQLDGLEVRLRLARGLSVLLGLTPLQLFALLACALVVLGEARCLRGLRGAALFELTVLLLDPTRLFLDALALVRSTRAIRVEPRALFLDRTRLRIERLLARPPRFLVALHALQLGFDLRLGFREPFEAHLMLETRGLDSFAVREQLHAPILDGSGPFANDRLWIFACCTPYDIRKARAWIRGLVCTFSHVSRSLEDS